MLIGSRQYLLVKLKKETVCKKKSPDYPVHTTPPCVMLMLPFLDSKSVFKYFFYFSTQFRPQIDHKQETKMFGKSNYILVQFKLHILRASHSSTKPLHSLLYNLNCSNKPAVIVFPQRGGMISWQSHVHYPSVLYWGNIVYFTLLFCSLHHLTARVTIKRTTINTDSIELQIH